MPAISEDKRIEELRRLRASDPLIRLSSGDCVHQAFRNRCLGPPYYVYHGAGTPDGSTLIPLWDDGDTVVGVWQRGGHIEFIEFSIEADDQFESVARTEQGFWATRFDILYEADVSLGELREAAAAVGFRFLERLLAAHYVHAERISSYEGHAAWLRELVDGIDRDATE